MIKRRKTRQVRVGNVRIGGSAPVSIQSMIKVETRDVSRVVAQVRRLENCGCEIIRVAVKNMADAKAINIIKKQIKIPIVADIHFDYRLALEAIKSGVDKIRLNPGNIKNREHIKAVVRAAKNAGIPIRIGVNSGSVGSEVLGHRSGEKISSSLVKAAMGYVKLFEAMDFRDIIVSLKASDVISTLEAYRAMSKQCDYPLHLGVTASGSYESGVIKSAIGIGALLADGIGDTIRVSLTADPEEEVLAAKRILSSLDLRNFGPEIISCPTCGRCQVDLLKIVNEVEKKVIGLRSEVIDRGKKLRIAIMGCEVNGPGEAKEVDIGIAFGKGSGIIFVKGKILERVKEKSAIKKLLKEIGRICKR